MRICRTVWVAVAVAGLAAAQTDDDMLSVRSPNGEIELKLYSAFPSETEAVLPRLAYSVSFHGKPLMATSYLGFDIDQQVPLGEKLGLVRATEETLDETYTLVAGKASRVRNHYNSLVAQYLQNGSQGRLMTMEVRAYDDGVAFRYVVPWSPPIADLRLTGEVTQFNFAKDGDTYPLELDGFQTPYEDEYRRATLSGIHEDALVALPFLVNQPGVGWVAVTEADLDDYPGMYLQRIEGRRMKAALAPRVDGSGLVLERKTPLTTPWRVLLIGDTAAELIDSNIVTSLNPASEIADTSWIQAGKAAWDWWSGSQAEGVDFEPGMNTATMNHYIDFAAASGLEYMLIDAGWSFEANGGTDLTRTVRAIDMPAILAHAKQKGVGVWLWAHWSAVESQMDQAFPLFEKWGVKGVKIDYMNRDDQQMVNFYRRVAKAAADHHLMLDFHGAYKPDGLRRTFPNVLTREGVMGLEYEKWSARTNPAHDVMLAFTRLLAGPMDYTPGGFDNVTRAEFVARSSRPEVLGTRAHQLALYVVFESPLQMVADYPEAYRGARDFDFIREVPATWDETRAVAGEVGKYVAIARRRGEEWYLGTITDWTAREVDVPLSFLGAGEWVAEIYADAADAGEHPKKTRVEERRVTSGSALRLEMAEGGGAAVRFRRAE